MEEEIVTLQCIKVKGKLRVRVYNNSNYHPYLNCQFPRNIREENSFYTIQGPLGVRQIKGTYFYSAINTKTIKKIGSTPSEKLNKVYDSGVDECSICLTNEKSIIYVPCGHFCVCSECHTTNPLDKCIMCRGKITSVLSYDDYKKSIAE